MTYYRVFICFFIYFLFAFLEGQIYSEKVTILTILLTFSQNGGKFQILHSIPTFIPEYQNICLSEWQWPFTLKQFKQQRIQKPLK